MNLTYFRILIICFISFACSSATNYQDPIPKHETFKLDSKTLDESRVINIWLPEDYHSKSDSLPVLYMADGGINEDFPHIANTIEELINQKKIPPIILVGIENIQRRKDLTGPTEVEKDKEIAPEVGGSAKFRSFIHDELIPHINSNYRTNQVKGIIGESLSGYFVVETLLLNPEMFDFYIAFDPSMWWNDQKLIKTAKENLTKIPANQNKTFWFAGSDAQDIYLATRELANILENEKNPNLKWKYSDEPTENHSTIFRATKEKAIIWTLGRKDE